MKFNQVYTFVASIPKGKVATYGEIAKALKIRDARLVGYALHANKNLEKVPCYRVVKTGGELAHGYAYGGKKTQKKLLQKDGIRFYGDQVMDLEKVLWKGHRHKNKS